MSGRARFLAVVLGVLPFLPSAVVLADEGGVSFWLPGQFGSLAAAPAQPGWSIATTYYHPTVNGGGDVAAARELTVGRFSRNLNVDVNVGLHAHLDLALLTGTYVFATPVAGGQFALGMTGIVGGNTTTLNGNLSASLGRFSA